MRQAIFDWQRVHPMVDYELLIKRLKKASRLLGQLHDLDAGLEAHASRKQRVHAVAPVLHELRDALR